MLTLRNTHNLAAKPMH